MRAKMKDNDGPIRVVFYIRFSSWKQDAENTVEGQMQALQAYADSHGMVVVGIYTDEAIPGKRDDRKELNRLMRDARNRSRPFDRVLVWKFDRFGRRASTMGRRIEDLEELGIGVTAIQQPIQGKPAVVKFFRTIMSGAAEYAIDNMGEDIARGQKTSASHGVWTAPTVPLGLKADHRMDRGKIRPFLIPDPETSWIIQRMFKMYVVDKIGSTKIAETFRDEGVPNYSDKPWTGPDVLRRLKNIAYAGFIHHGERSQYDDAEVITPWPEMEIISMTIYDQAQIIMASRTPELNHPRQVASRHLLSGLVFCDTCDCKMSPTGGERSYYNCNERRKGLSACKTPNPGAERLDAVVLQYMLDKILTQENTERILDIVAKSQTETALVVEDELKNVNLEIENVKAARRNLLKLVEDGHAVQGDISERLNEIRETLVRLESNAVVASAKVSNEQAIISDPEKVTAYAQDLKTYLRGTNRDLTKGILGELIEQVRVLPGEDPNTATLIIRYRVPAPPSGWTRKTDVKELLLRGNVRSLGTPAEP